MSGDITYRLCKFPGLPFVGKSICHLVMALIFHITHILVKTWGDVSLSITVWDRELKWGNYVLSRIRESNFHLSTSLKVGTTYLELKTHSQWIPINTTLRLRRTFNFTQKTPLYKGSHLHVWTRYNITMILKTYVIPTTQWVVTYCNFSNYT